MDPSRERMNQTFFQKVIITPSCGTVFSYSFSRVSLQTYSRSMKETEGKRDRKFNHKA